jgi:hypothetical protein
MTMRQCERSADGHETRPRRAAATPAAWVGALALAAGMLAGTPAIAAGGHHSVDDAAILDPGLCKLEGWYSDASAGERLLHAGGACRVGPVELNASSVYAREGDRSLTGYALQGKWATELAPGFSAGLLLATGWQAHVQPRWEGTSLSGLFTWSPRDDLAFHLNLGRDFLHSADDLDRAGAAVEWTVRPGWSIVGERFLALETHAARLGLRWAINDAWTVDVSRAQRISGPLPSNWTIGASWQFERP